MSKFLIPALTIASLTLTACTEIVERIPGVYTIDIQQGNIFDQEIVDQLRPNMNKRQVLYIMGSPMLRDVFHQKRWDYIYSEQPGGEARVQKRLSLYFEGDSLIGVQGDFRPSSVPVFKPSKEVTIDIPERTVERTMSEKVIDLFSFGDSDMPVKPEDAETTTPDTKTDAPLEAEDAGPETPVTEPETDAQEAEPTTPSASETDATTLETTAQDLDTDSISEIDEASPEGSETEPEANESE